VYEVEWKVQPPEKETDRRVAGATAGRWLILGENGGVASELELELKGRGFDAARIGTPVMAIEGSDPDRCARPNERALDEIRDAIHRGDVAGVVNLAVPDPTGEDGGAAFEMQESGFRDTYAGLRLMQVLLEETGNRDTALWMATRGAVAVKDGESPELQQTPLWACTGRSCRNCRR